MYERVLAIVPIVGAGTWADPQRPMFAPIPAHMKPSDRSGIIAFHHQISDDGKFALVEYVTANKGALASVLTLLNQGATTAGIQVFERGKSTPAQIEAAFKAKKKDFDLNRFQVAVQ